MQVKMPQMGESITEGTIVKWHKHAGDRVERDEILFEISTDKVDTEIPSPAKGYLAEILVPEGETVPVDTPVCVLSEADPGGAGATTAATAVGAVPKAEAALPPVAASTAGVAAATPRAPEKRLSPAVRRLVREHGVDVSTIRGTGQGGRVTQKDVLKYLESRDSGSARPTVASGAAGSTRAAPPEARVERLSVMRQKIAEHMVRSKTEAPHVSTIHEVDMSRVVARRDELRERWRERGVKPTYLPFIIQTAAEALRRFPLVNATLKDAEVHYPGEVNIGVAVALEDGLIVPVIRRADGLSLLELSRALKDLAGRARSKALQPDEVQGGTFSITNPGAFGSLVGTPIIHQPQSAILCVGAVKKRPVVLEESDAIAVRSMCLLSLSFDHRLIDGALADRFLSTVTGALEAGHFREE
ncbi:MAG: dihydrolipoamide acetyltransferase family protein [Planctomycetota bacterium]|nr:dihydrolipoamide acetyltransferase family protein [Planctomycetota bacterium]